MEGLAKLIASGVLAVGLQAQTYHEHTTMAYSGFAAHYHAGVMDTVAQNRGMSIEDCMIAATYEELGTWMMVHSDIDGDELTCRVTDYPAPQDRQRIIDKGIIIELDLESAKKLCNIKRYGQTMPKECPVTVWRLE